MLFESGNITPLSIMDIVNTQGDSVYYLVKELPEKIRKAGLATVKAFGVKSRFVHLEFFVLNEDQAGPVSYTHLLMASMSKLLVGSSSMTMSGLPNSACASRIFTLRRGSTEAICS